MAAAGSVEGKEQNKAQLTLGSAQMDLCAPMQNLASAGGPAETQDAGELQCVSCECPTTVADSQQYGRNPFKRRCNDCCSAYRCAMSTISKEKKASATNSSPTGEFFNRLTPDEKVAWYKKQKRSRELKHKPRDLGVVTMDASSRKGVKRGRQQYNDMISFASFCTMKKAMGEEDPSRLSEEWRKLLTTPGVKRDEVELPNGTKETVVGIFGGIRDYVDMYDEFATGVSENKQIKTQADFDATSENTHRRCLQLKWNWLLRQRLSCTHLCLTRPCSTSQFRTASCPKK